MPEGRVKRAGGGLVALAVVVAVVVGAVVGLSGCRALDCEALSALEANLEEIAPRFRLYVESDGELAPDPEVRRRRERVLVLLMESTVRLVRKLKESCR